jgi:hypothetical protein
MGVKAISLAAITVLVQLAFAGAPFLVPAEAEIPQPSPTNDTLFLHSSGQSTWMNAEKNQTTGGLAAGGYGWRSFSFLLDPALDRSTFLIMNISSEWIACVHATCVYYFGGNGTLQGLNASIVLKDFTYYAKEPERVDDNYIFRFSVDLDIIKPQWAFNFTFRHIGPDMGPPPFVTFFTDGSSYIQIPIAATDIDTDNDAFPDSIDPDDDNDGHNDTNDAYPQDPTRWEKPTPAQGVLPGFEAVPTIIAFLAVAISKNRRGGKTR